MTKRILILSDTHCGATTGLTPDKFNSDKHKHHEQRARLWKWFVERINKYKPYDILMLNGDGIDGKGEKQGGTETVFADRDEQVDICVEVLKATNAKSIQIIAGTPYHTGTSEDTEKRIADKIGGNFSDKGFFKVNGKELNLRHFVSASTLPHTKLTPLAREIMLNRQWYLEGTEPKADILIRSHVHYYEQIYHDGCLGFITPGLQILGGKYGARKCSGVIHFGFIIIDINNEGEIAWCKEILQGKHQRTRSKIL